MMRFFGINDKSKKEIDREAQSHEIIDCDQTLHNVDHSPEKLDHNLHENPNDSEETQSNPGSSYRVKNKAKEDDQLSKEIELSNTVEPIFDYPEELLPLNQMRMTPDQKDLFEAFTSWAKALIDNNAEDSEDQKWFLDDLCIFRYLRAANWKLEMAKKNLLATMKWRQKVQPHRILPDDIEIEALTGKMYINGFDKYGRTMIYMRPRKENTKDHANQLKYLFFCLEKAKRLAPPDVKKCVLLIDLLGYNVKNAPSVNVCKDVIKTLNQHYPGCVGASFLINTPWIFVQFFRLFYPLLDPFAKQRIYLVNLKSKKLEVEKEEMNCQWADLLNYVSADVLEAPFAGSNPYTYNHEIYWPKLCKAIEKFV